VMVSELGIEAQGLGYGFQDEGLESETKDCGLRVWIGARN
jgi:hypothetical protein